MKGVGQMAKTSNVMARVEPEVKEQAENILAQLGLPVSVVINSLYRQIIMRNGLPFQMAIPVSIPSRDTMNSADFSVMMDRGIEQAKNNNSIPLDDAMNDLLRGL